MEKGDAGSGHAEDGADTLSSINFLQYPRSSHLKLCLDLSDALNVITPLSAEVEAMCEAMEWWDGLAGAVGYGKRPEKAMDEAGKQVTSYGAEDILDEGRHCLFERCLEEHGREEGSKVVERRKQMGWVAKAHKALTALKADWEAAEKVRESFKEHGLCGRRRHG